METKALLVAKLQLAAAVIRLVGNIIFSITLGL